MKTLLAVLGALSLVTLVSTSMPRMASAQASPSEPVAADEHCDANGGYCYKFVDDVLNDKGLDSTAPLIHVRPTGLRSTLIRPRTQFVSEMLKSVEAI